MKRMMTKEEYLAKRREVYAMHKKETCLRERMRRESKRPPDLKRLGRYSSEDELKRDWKQIPDHPDYYASLSGEIVGKHRRIMIGRVDRCGYKNVILREGSLNKQHLAHRLIAETFIDKPEGKNFINHKDGNKVNNAVDNLEWVTKSENTLHSFENGLQKTINGTEVIRGERLQFVKDNIGVLSDEEIANALHCRKDTIRKLRYKILKGEK